MIMTHNSRLGLPVPGSVPAPAFALALAISLAMVLPATSPLAAQESAGLPHGFDAGWQGRQTCAVLYETAEVRVGQCQFDPGIGHEKHYHNPHFGFVIEGSTMLIKDASGEREQTTRAGDTWSTTSITVHEAINIGNTIARYLIVEPRPADTGPAD